MEKRLKTRHEIADELGISYHTLKRILKEQNIQIAAQRYLTPQEQQLIFKCLLKED